MAKKKVNEAASAQLNPNETKVLTYLLHHPEVLVKLQGAKNPEVELGSIVNLASLGIQPSSDISGVFQFLDIHEAVQTEAKTTDKVAKSFLAGTPQKVANDSTDGKSFFLHGNEIAKKEKDGLYISDAGWPTPTTRDRINSILKELGSKVFVAQKQGKQILSIKGKEQPWSGEWTKVTDEIKGEDWEGSGPGSQQSVMSGTTRIPMMTSKEPEAEIKTEKKKIVLPKWAKKK